jgi:hypothetical protein
VIHIIQLDMNLFCLNNNIMKNTQSLPVNKRLFFERFIIFAFIMSAFSQPIIAWLGQNYPSQRFYFVLIVQGLLYFPPILFFFITPFYRIKLYIASLFIIFILSAYFFKSTTTSETLLGVKNYLLPMFYIPIIAYVYKGNSFRYKFEKALSVVIISYALVPIFEIISLGFPNELNNWFKSLAPSIYYGQWRPLGLSLTMHMQGTVLAIGCLYFYFKHKRILFLICTTGLLMATVKTWIIGGIVTYALYAISNFSSKILHDILKYISILLVLILASLLFTQGNGVFEYYLYSSEMGNAGTRLMLEGIFDIVPFLKSGFVPNGFATFSNNMINSDFNSYVLPSFFTKNTVFLYKMIFQLGIIMTGLWVFIIWRYLFSTKNGFIFKNEYKTLLFLSLFSLVHTSSLQTLFIFITVMYFAESHKLSNKVF